MNIKKHISLLLISFFIFLSPQSLVAQDSLDDFDSQFENFEPDQDFLNFDDQFDDPWATDSSSPEWQGNISFFGGKKKLAQGDWDTLDSHDEWGIKLDMKKIKWPISMIISYHASVVKDSSNYVEGNTSEISVGIRKKWRLGEKYYIYAGGGQSQIYAEIRSTNPASVASDDDTGIGYWLETGLHYNVFKSMTLGLDIVWSSAEVKLFGESGDAGGLHYGISAGTNW